jgi:hypothetical protein
MENGHWRDPYVVALEKLRNGYMHQGALRLAVADFCRGIESLPGLDKIRVMTDYEAWRGVAGTTISSVKLGTSAGAPFFSPKRGYVEFNDEGREVLVHPAVTAQIEELYSILRTGCAPMPFCMHTKKDEPIGAQKNLEHAVRIFNTCPMAWNFLIKKYLGPISVLIKANREFFETALGINMTSMEDVNWLVRIMQKFLGSLSDEDYKGYDGTQCFDLQMRGTFEVVSRLVDCFLLYSEEEKLFAKLLFCSCVWTIRCINGDLFMTAAWNPSGCNITLEINDLGNSILERYAFFFLLLEKGFLEKELGVLNFRSFVLLMTFGDDLIKSRSSKVSTWYTPKEKQRVLAKSGFSVVPASKTGDFEIFKDMVGLNFLKRGFREESGIWFAPLSLKTLGKMLSLRMKGTLSDVDHHAVILSNLMREVFLHGQALYKRVRPLVEEVAKKYKLERSDLYLVRDYEVLLAEYKSGQFKSWEINLAGEDDTFLVERVPRSVHYVSNERGDFLHSSTVEEEKESEDK